MWKTYFITKIIKLTHPQRMWKTLWKTTLPVEKTEKRTSVHLFHNGLFQQDVEMWKTLPKLLQNKELILDYNILRCGKLFSNPR